MLVKKTLCLGAVSSDLSLASADNMDLEVLVEFLPVALVFIAMV
jgi:hypothetical protein